MGWEASALTRLTKQARLHALGGLHGLRDPLESTILCFETCWESGLQHSAESRAVWRHALAPATDAFSTGYIAVDRNAWGVHVSWLKGLGPLLCRSASEQLAL